MTEPPNSPPPTRAWQPGQPGPGQPGQPGHPPGPAAPPATQAWQPTPGGPGQPPLAPGHPNMPPGVPPGFDAGPPPGYEATTAITPPAKAGRFGGKNLRLPLLAAAGVAVAAVAVTGFWKPGFLHTRMLDVHAAEDGVRHVLSDPTIGYGAGDVSEVHCNDGKNPVIKAGTTFTCKATIAGSTRTVEVTFADGKGGYWVGSPT